MLVKGNAKLGKSIWCFSIPAGSTCPGKSELCDDRCYAQKGMFLIPSVQHAHASNLEATKMDDFVARMVAEIKQSKTAVVRIHSSGDFYDDVYARKWRTIVKTCPGVTFFTYTRSWRVPYIRREITRFAHDCRNLKLFFSIDSETGYPKNVPSYIRCAYLAIADWDVPTNNVDLVFRDYNIRGRVQKYINGVLVCPPENGVTKLTCEQCGLCWRRTTVPKGPPDTSRISLSLVA